jgi:hypothetical protein
MTEPKVTKPPEPGASEEFDRFQDAPRQARELVAAFGLASLPT